MDFEDLPYRVEYSKSSRASCRKCRQQIVKEILRLAIMIQSHRFDGKVPQWYHFDCFFEKFRPKTIGDIAHVESLRYEDQEKLKEKINSFFGAVIPVKKGKKRSAKAASSTTNNNNQSLNDYTIEYAKTARSLCRGCEQKILKDNVRISKKDFGNHHGGQDKWHHVDCFVKLRNELEFFASGNVLPGFESLKPEDKKTVKAQLPAIKQNDIPIKKPKIEEDDKLEKEIKTQSEIIFKNRDALKELKKKEILEILQHNGQHIPIGVDKMLDLLSDVMTFGALEQCLKCKDGNFVFHISNYICQGNLSEWSKCQNIVKEPKRKLFSIPEKYENRDCFKNYKYKPGIRKFRPNPVIATTAEAKTEDENTGPKIVREKPILYDMQFVFTGFKRNEKNKLKNEIEKLGGVVQKNCFETSMAVIATEKQVDNIDRNYHIQNAKTLKIHVVSEEFVTEAKNYAGKIPELLQKTSICPWGDDPTVRMPKDQKSEPVSRKSMYSLWGPSVQKVYVKDGGTVDPLSYLEQVAHVYKENKEKYSVMLSLTDLQSQKNSFYKIQILEADQKKLYWVFRSWGRIATRIGGHKTDDMGSAEEAKNLFKSLYEEKTGNKWENRDNFVKIPGKMCPVDIDEGVEDEEMEVEEPETHSKHPQPVQEIIKLIFDLTRMNQTMAEFELDLDKMPLGKLSKKQIQSAYSVLTELQNLIDNPSTACNHNFIDCSNRFYTFIPHSFGLENPPLINTAELIKEKITMLDNLMELEIAYNMLVNKKGKNNSVDELYEQLKTDFEVLDKNSEEYKTIKEYVRNTHTHTHTQYKLEIEEVFKIKRHGEEERYKRFRKLHNKKLLWHGSRLTNFAGILSQGLRIAPPEAPASGYMFGKGIYFADMVSKSANYCCANYYNPIGLMLLSEVALGNMYEREQADYIEKLPSGKHSCKGLGQCHPNPKKSIFKDDVEIPLGKEVDTKKKTILLYNEYIVYDVAQVNMKYLLRMNFNHKY